MKIKILSGWSAPGGSTAHHISLTNLLNKNGYDCTFYGPHDWHLDKCQSGKIQEVKIDPEDIVISHFLDIPEELKVKKHILSLHETDLFPLQKVQPKGCDLIQYVSHSQKDWHAYEHDFVVIPPVVEQIDWKAPEEGSDRSQIAGVVGSIDKHKQPHLSIQKALEDGFERVLLFGIVSDKEYFEEFIVPYLENGRAVLLGYLEDKAEMYGLISKVYHMSKRETYGLVESECKLAGIPYEGLVNNQPILAEEDILNLWKEVLDK